MSIPRPLPTLAVLVTAALLAGCNASADIPGPTAAAALPPAPAPAPVVADLPAGSGCGPSIARIQAVVDSDVATENLAESVGKRFGADLHQAATACSAGREGEAMRLLASAKARYGYR